MLPVRVSTVLWRWPKRGAHNGIAIGSVGSSNDTGCCVFYSELRRVLLSKRDARQIMRNSTGR